MSTSANNRFDAIGKIIFEQDIRMEAIDFHPELDLMLVVLNTKAVLRFPISRFDRLKGRSRNQLGKYSWIGKGISVHWEELDEDISLKSLLRDILLQTVGSNGYAMSA